MRPINKLVRDRIPSIIIANGETPVWRTISSDEEYRAHLFLKFQEEVAEFTADPSLAEAADILEVVECLLAQQNLSFQDALAEQARKRTRAGSFRNRVFLEGVEDLSLAFRVSVNAALTQEC